MNQYAANLAASLHAGARLGPDEAARAVLPLAEAIALEHAHGMVRGSIDGEYVAPEVEAGQAPSTAGDVWSVGALLFHAMAGHAPFEHSPEPPARLRRAGWLGPLVEMALAPDPAARPDMSEVAAYLRPRETAAGVPEPTVPLPVPPPTPPAAAPAMAGAVSGAEPTREPRDRRTTIAALVLAALVVVVALIAAVLVLGRGHDDHTATPASGDTSAVPSSPSSPAPSTSATAPRGPKRPTASTLVAFGRTYVMAASRDPQAAFRMLTPAYQRRSPRYQQFWSHVSNPRIQRISADPARMTVTYTYRYTLPGRGGRVPRTETVTLDVVQQGGKLRIANAH